MKLYPKQSQAVKPTSLSTGIKLPNSEIDLIGKIEVFFHHKLDDVLSGYIWGGENTSGPSYATTALYLNSTKNAYYVYYKGSAPASLATSALEDDNYYIFSTDFTQATVKIIANKVTIVNNAKVIGSNINGTAQTKGTQELTTDLGILSGRNNTAYVVSSKHKIIWVKIYDLSGDLMHEFNFSEGAGETTYDVVTGNAYPISNINLDPAAFWNYKQDFNHYNFRYGFTLYQKSGSPDIRIPNKLDGSEIILPAPPSGYTRVANYKECRETFNQCESVFVLDNVDVQSIVLSGALTPTGYNGIYVQNGTWAGNPKYDKIDDPTKNIWKSGTPYDIYGWTVGDFSSQGYWFEHINGDGDDSTPFPWDVVSFSPFWVVGATGTVSVDLTPASPLKTADVDDVLFDDLGVAKEINIGALDVDLNFNRGYMYINPNISEHDFMLYKTNKTLKDDEKILKYIGLKDEVMTTEVVNPQTLEVTEETVEDENDHVILEG